MTEKTSSRAHRRTTKDDEVQWSVWWPLEGQTEEDREVFLSASTKDHAAIAEEAARFDLKHRRGMERNNRTQTITVQRHGFPQAATSPHGAAQTFEAELTPVEGRPQTFEAELFGGPSLNHVGFNITPVRLRGQA